MYQEYEQPVMEIMRFDEMNVIRTSIGDGDEAGWGDNEFQEPYLY